ncbi:endolytic transglycosylase MltG [Streptomyces sp. NPDC048172]|uniref:endolytic transglycosylase MltG n=1 Tax=Streptomyces sp. NPDC048172 TaxID=3365505 RepID=UPI003711ABB7
MTEYGQGPGSQPWHPDDPLYGDQEWNGGQPVGQHNGWNQPPYDGQPQQPYHPQQHAPQHQAPQYQAPQHQTPQYQTPQAQHQAPQQQYDGSAYGWGGQQYDPSYGAGGTDPYGMPPVDPYGTGEQPDYYAAQGGYPPPRPQHMRGQPAPGQYEQYEQQVHPHPGHPQPGHPHPGGPGGPGAPDPDTGWDPGPDQGEHAFFTDRGEEDPERQAFLEEEEDARRGRRGGKGGKPKRDDGTKRRSGCACAVVSAVLVALVGTGGYFAYQFYQSHFAPAPDYSGSGSGEVQVDIPDGASISDMGDVLKREGVIKSSGAFVDASNGNKKAQSIQAGTYTLRKEMSASSAVDMMLDPASQNGLIIAEGWRAKKVYEAIDEKLDAPKGTTKKVANKADLGLPGWAKGKPEGFLFPSKYSVGKNSKPEDVLRQMVKRAEAEYSKTGLESAAKKTGKSPEEIITIASLIQAEAQQDHEFGKVSRVIWNRLDDGMLLGFDSTINYAKGRSTLNTSVEDTRYPSPYNTYLHKGLPPGPIGNPGHQAVEAALKPTKGNWLYFVTVKPGDTRFTDSKSEHDKNVQDFNSEQRKQNGSGG